MSTRTLYWPPGPEKEPKYKPPKTGVYPSNADIMYFGKKTADDDASDIGKFHPRGVLDANTGKSPAPKGHFLFDPFYLDRASVANLEEVEGFEFTLPAEISKVGPAAVAFYAGRAWYGGTPNAKYSNLLFYSQIIETDDNIGNCYQRNDPTSEQFPDLLDTDGGVLTLPEAGQVIRLLASNANLLVFATNGVWAVGGSDGGFTATKNTVRKISSVGILDQGSIVEAENEVYFWANTGIYKLTPDNITGYLTAESVTIDTIQTWYDDLAAVAKFRVFGMYDTTRKQIFWYYNPNATYDTGVGVFDYPSRYTKALVYSLALKAFFPYEFGYPTETGGTAPQSIFAGATMTPPVQRSAITQNVVDVNEDQVINAALDTVVVSGFTTAATAESQIVLTITGAELEGFDIFQIGWSSYTDDVNYRDFEDWNVPTDMPVPYMETGYEIEGDVTLDKGIVYVSPVFKRTELTYTVTGNPTPTSSWDKPSACTIQAKWDWTDATESGKWSDEEDAYRLLGSFTFDDTSDGNKSYPGGQTVVKTKLRVRGQGAALQLRFEGETGKDVHLYGWQTILEGVTVA